jgi:hypothetical protein
MKPIKVKLTPIVTYNVESEDGTNLGEFCLVSEWEGFTKLRSSPDNALLTDATMIVINPKSSPFDVLFGRKEDARECLIARCDTEVLRNMGVNDV